MYVLYASIRGTCLWGASGLELDERLEPTIAVPQDVHVAAGLRVAILAPVVRRKDNFDLWDEKQGALEGGKDKRYEEDVNNSEEEMQGLYAEKSCWLLFLPNGTPLADWIVKESAPWAPLVSISFKISNISVCLFSP